jgi:MarR family transcriptional regulator, lower aerobic nicotinate degradation pathway regulator
VLKEPSARTGAAQPLPPYVLDDQVGFILRQVYQRHAALFAERFGDDVTPTQWAVIAKLAEVGDCSQNLLGRLTSMDVVTIKGVVERLARRGLVETKPDADDRRRLTLSLSAAGKEMFEAKAAIAAAISEETLAPLAPADREALLRLLHQLR